MAAVSIVVRDALGPHQVTWLNPHAGFCWACQDVIGRAIDGRCPNEIFRRYAWPR